MADGEDVEFVEFEPKMAGLFCSAKRIYLLARENRGAAIDSTVVSSA